MKKTKLWISLGTAVALASVVVPTIVSCSKTEDNKTVITFFCNNDGALEGNEMVEVLPGTSWKDIKKPIIIPKKGFAFNGWFWWTQQLYEGFKISSNTVTMTVTAHFKQIT